MLTLGAHTHTRLCTLTHRHFLDPHPAVQIPELVLTAPHICADMFKHILLPAACGARPGGQPLPGAGGEPLDADRATAWEGEGGQSHPSTWKLSGNHTGLSYDRDGGYRAATYPEPSSTSKGQ